MTQDTNITQEGPRNEFFTSAWTDETQPERHSQIVQFEGFDATSVLLWPDCSHLADNRLATRYCVGRRLMECLYYP